MPEQFKIDYGKNGRNTASKTFGFEQRCGWSKAQLQPCSAVQCLHNCSYFEDIGMSQTHHNSRIQLINGVYMPYVGLGKIFIFYFHSIIVI